MVPPEVAMTDFFASESDGYIDVPLLDDEQVIRQQTASYLVYRKPIWAGQLALTNQRLLFRAIDANSTSKMTKDGIEFLPDDLAVLGQVVDKVLDYSTVYTSEPTVTINAPAISGVRAGMDAALLHPPSLVLTFSHGETLEVGILKSMGCANFWHANNEARDEMVAEILSQLVSNGLT
jgi:hypothetical protein